MRDGEDECEMGGQVEEVGPVEGTNESSYIPSSVAYLML